MHVHSNIPDYKLLLKLVVSEHQVLEIIFYVIIVNYEYMGYMDM